MNLRIGALTLEGRVFQSPMADCTDLAFRLVAREHGLRFAFLEMVSAHSLLRRNPKTLDMMRTTPEDRPLGAQLVGTDPGLLADAAALVEEMGFDLVDLNCGCPAPKIVTTGAGAGLLRTPEKTEEIFRRMARAVRRIPVTMKTRVGFEEPGGREAEDLARRAEAQGLCAVTVHGRTRKQRYAGAVDFDAIARVKRSVRIPVLANGGVMAPLDAKTLLDATGCDGIVIGRGGLGNPWIYRAAECALEGKPLPAIPGIEDRRQALLRHLDLELRYEDRRRALLAMRRVSCWYFTGTPGAAALRGAVCSTANDEPSLRKIIEDFGR
ncbi:MAG: tRNA dihydrouridine synthase DusB [Elusimicrobiota bacterium]|jgi:nifR3 family TIM-barrel protein